MGALAELPLPSFKTRSDHTDPTSSCSLYPVGRTATGILSRGLSRAFFGPWSQYDFIRLAVYGALTPGRAGAQEAEGYTVECLLHHNGGDGSGAFAKHMLNRRSTHLGTPEPSVVRKGLQCGTRRLQSSSHPCFLNYAHSTHSLNNFQSQDMIW